MTETEIQGLVDRLFAERNHSNSYMRPSEVDATKHAREYQITPRGKRVILRRLLSACKDEAVDRNEIDREILAGHIRDFGWDARLEKRLENGAIGWVSAIAMSRAHLCNGRNVLEKYGGAVLCKEGEVPNGDYRLSSNRESAALQVLTDLEKRYKRAR